MSRESMLLTEKMRTRFWGCVNRTDACWLWTGTIKKNGYGEFSVGNGKKGTRRRLRAHRVAWFIEHGDLPGALHVLHRCDVRACVRPDHLFLGTPHDNTQDMIRKGRHPTMTVAAVARKRARRSGKNVLAVARELTQEEADHALFLVHEMNRQLSAVDDAIVRVNLPAAQALVRHLIYRSGLFLDALRAAEVDRARQGAC